MGTVLYNNRRNTIFTGNGDSGGTVGIQYIRQGDAAYPEKLKVYQGMPKELWYRNRLPDPKKRTVAIVGARQSSEYGNAMSRMFARELARAGVQIVSGMAWGIDGFAHAGALDVNGDTFAVLGGGVDVCYPAGHRGLYEHLLRRGGVLSEQPPGTPPKAGYFPARNRIISALSDLVLVVEAKKRSGSLITVDFALEQGKDVFAVPGRVGDVLSEGCLGLLKQGAGLADSPQTLLDALGLSGAKEADSETFPEILLAKDENIVYSWIRLQPVPVEELVRRTGFSAQRLLPILVGLELKGLVREVQKAIYIRTDMGITDGKIFGDSGVACKGEDH